jgi:hypothetical protein
MKELIRKNKFKHKIGLGGYKAAIPLWTNKEHELRETGIPDPLEDCMLRTKNWTWGRSRLDNSGQLVTSNSDITRVIENVKNLVTKEKAGKFKPQRQKDQISAAHKSKKNIEVAHELSLQLHRGTKGLRRTSICKRSVEGMMRNQVVSTLV